MTAVRSLEKEYLALMDILVDIDGEISMAASFGCSSLLDESIYSERRKVAKRADRLEKKLFNAWNKDHNSVSKELSMYFDEQLEDERKKRHEEMLDELPFY